VRLEALRKYFHAGQGEVRAVDGVDLTIKEGEAVGLVGESGSGKSTLARCLLRLTEVTGGSIYFQGEEITRLRGRQLRRLRGRVQMVFQDPLASLDPRQTVRSAIEEPLRLLLSLTAKDRERRLLETLDLVHLQKAHLERYPHQLSGGQQQRVGIARALATRPKLCVLDEPTSALDWPIRAEILELLSDLRRELGLSYLLISHDLSAVRYVCERIAVMYLGRIVEEAPAKTLFASAAHPYTKALLSAVLQSRLGERQARLRLSGEPPSPIDPPTGCHLHPRCPIAIEDCAKTEQELRSVASTHRVACMRLTGSQKISWPEGWANGGDA
jgi:peptide/nickel transport system ATP-binding protein